MQTSEEDPTGSAVPGPPILSAQTLRDCLGHFPVVPIGLQGRKPAAVAVGVSQAGWGPDLPGLPQHEQWSDAPALLLTRRAAGLRAHAGQWALPGGRIDTGETPEQAALRELTEEIGLTLGPESVLGRLDDYATRSGYVITPVVVWAGSARELKPAPAEVQSIHRIPVTELLRPDAPLLNLPLSGEHPVLRMPVGASWIAAPTAAFLYQFREWLLLGRPTRVAHFDQPFFAWR
jgi:mutator protein MutT